MTITPSQAIDAVNYLVASRALTVTDHQGEVWADYLNHEVNDPQPYELLPACRRAIKDWRAGGRGFQVDVETFAMAVRAIRRERVDADEQANGQPSPAGLDDEPVVRNRWLDARRHAIELGATPERADAAAWAAVGRTPPPPSIGDGSPTGAARARAVLEELARRSRRP